MGQLPSASTARHHSTPSPSSQIPSSSLRSHNTVAMASSLRMSAPKMANMAAQSSVKVARQPMMAQKFTRAYSAAARQNTAFNTMKRTSNMMNKASPIGAQASRAYSSEMANAMVQVSQNLGMGQAAIGLG